MKKVVYLGTNSIHPELAVSCIKTGNIYPESVVTKIIPLDKIKDEGFEVLAGENKADIKILVEPFPA